MTAAASLVLTAGMVAFFVSGVGSDEVSRTEYRQGLTSKLAEDDRLEIPPGLSEDETDSYLTCLVDGSYPNVTDAARRLVAGDESLTDLHRNDFEVVIFRALDCKEDGAGR